MEIIEPIYGTLPSHWKMVTINELIEQKKANLQTGPFGTMLHASAYQSKGSPVVAVQHIGENRLLHSDMPRVDSTTYQRLNRYRLQPGDILFGRKGSVERRALIRAEEDGWLQGSDCIRLRLETSEIDPAFVSYVLGTRAYREWISQNAQGATMPSLNQEILGRIPLPIPPLPKQHAIAGFLGALDDKIELDHRMNQTIESIARAVFRQWFVYNEDSTRWKLSKIGELGNLDKGVSYKGAFLTDEGMPMINLGCFQGKGNFNIEKLKKYSGEYKERHTVKPGDIVLANTDITQKREVIGSPAIVPDYPSKEYLFTHHVYAMRVNGNSAVLKNYLYFTLLQQEFRERAEGFATGTTVLALPRDAVLDYEISLPPAELLEGFYEQVYPLHQKMQSNVKESQTLAYLRDTLLPRLMHGEIRLVSDP